MKKKLKEEIILNHYQQLIQALQAFPSKAWINRYFDVQKKILEELRLENDDPRLGLSLNQDGSLPVNLGQRYILKPYTDGSIGIIVPIHFEEAAAGAETVFYFSTGNVEDAKFINLPFTESTELPTYLYHACIEESNLILQKAKKSGFRKYHVQLLYDFTMEQGVRNEILNEVKLIEK